MKMSMYYWFWKICINIVYVLNYDRGIVSIINKQYRNVQTIQYYSIIKFPSILNKYKKLDTILCQSCSKHFNKFALCSVSTWYIETHHVTMFIGNKNAWTSISYKYLCLWFLIRHTCTYLIRTNDKCKNCVI